MSTDHNAAQAAALRILKSHLAAKLTESPSLVSCGCCIGSIMEHAQPTDLDAAWVPGHLPQEDVLDARFFLLQGEFIAIGELVFKLKINPSGARYEFDRCTDMPGCKGCATFKDAAYAERELRNLVDQIVDGDAERGWKRKEVQREGC